MIDELQQLEKIFECKKCLEKQCEYAEDRHNLFCPMWINGQEFNNSKYKVMFVGKVARSENGEHCWQNCFKDGKEYYKKPWAFWNYTKEIVKRLYYEYDSCKDTINNSYEKIIITNLIKCGRDGCDKTTENIAKCCICENEFIKKEIDFFQPYNIIFYCYGKSKFYYEKLKEAFRKNIEECKEAETDKSISFNILNVLPNNKKIRCLMIGHPQGKKKEDFVKTVVNFIKNN